MDTIELLSEPERKHLLHTTIVEMSSKNPDKRLSIPVKKKKKKKAFSGPFFPWIITLIICEDWVGSNLKINGF